MPPLPSVPNVIRVVITNQRNDGRPFINVLHWTYGGTPPPNSVCATFAQEFWTQWTSHLTAHQPAQTSLFSVEVTDLSSDVSGGAIYTNGDTPVPGTSIHGMLPGSTAFLVSKFVARRFRGGHPRSYLPIGTTDDLNDDGDWKAASRDSMLAAYGSLVNGMVGAASGGTTLGEECAVSYTSKIVNPVPPYRRAVPLVMDIPVDGYSAGLMLATQRDRVRGR